MYVTPITGPPRINNHELNLQLLPTQGCRSREGRGPDFGRSVNPISTEGSGLCPAHYYSLPPGFSDLPTALLPNHERMELCNPAEVVRWQQQHTVFKPFEVFLISIDFYSLMNLTNLLVFKSNHYEMFHPCINKDISFCF